MPLLIAYGIATIGVEFATVFNNAMMPTLVPPERIGRLSGTGWATGYIGGILSLILVLGFMAANPVTGKTLFGLTPIFGLDPSTFQGDRLTGPLTAVWFMIFVLPMFLLTPDHAAKTPARGAVREGLRELRETLARLPKTPSMHGVSDRQHDLHGRSRVTVRVRRHLCRRHFRLEHDSDRHLRPFCWRSPAPSAAWLGGRLDDKLGPKTVVAGSLLILLGAIAAILLIDRDSIFFIPVTPPVSNGGLFAAPAEKAYLALGFLIGLAAGPMQAASRTMLIRLAPKDRITQCFGLFALTGKVTSFFGPLLIGIVTDVADSQKAGMAVLVLFFAGGLALLMRVKAQSVRALPA